MTRSSPKSQNTDRLYALYGTCMAVAAALVAAGLVLRLLLTADLYSDDYYFATFFRGGLPAFFAHMKEHFLRTGNGRLFVHTCAALSLTLGRTLTAVVQFLTLLLIPLAYSRMSRRSGTETAVTVALFSASVLLFPSSILREGFFWVAGFFNYVFPYTCLTLALWLQTRLRKSCPIWLWILFPILQLLCGATHEQFGAATAFATAALALLYMIDERAIRLRYLIAPVMNAAGFATIFLSPATRGRVEVEAASENLLERIGMHVAEIAQFFLEDRMWIFCALLFFVPPLYALLVRRMQKWLLWGIPMGVAFLLIRRIATRQLYVLFAFSLLCLYMLLISCAFALCEKKYTRAVLLPTGLFSVFVISLGSTIEPRVCVCLLLSTVLVLADVCADILSHLASQNKTSLAPATLSLAPATLSLALVLLCIVCAVPTFRSCLYNERIRNQNLDAVATAKETGTLYYCMDFDTEYVLSPMYAGGYFYNGFVGYYKLAGIDVRFESEIHPAVYVGDRKLAFTAMDEGDRVYFPIEFIAPALGGSSAWADGKSEICLGGRTYTVIGYTVSDGDVQYDATGHMANYRYYTMMFSRELLESVFRLTIQYDAAQNAYYVSVR